MYIIAFSFVLGILNVCGVDFFLGPFRVNINQKEKERERDRMKKNDNKLIPKQE